MKRTILNYWNTYGCLWLLIMISYHAHSQDNAVKIDSLKQLVEQNGDPRHIYDIGRYYMGSDFDSASAYFNRSLSVFKQLNDLDGKAKALIGISSILTYRGAYDSSLVLLDQAIAIADEIQQYRLKSSALNQAATNHYYRGNYAQAGKFFEASLKIATDSNNLTDISATSNNIALVYRVAGDYDKAIQWNMKSIEAAETLDDTSSISRSYNNLAMIFDDLGELDKAEEYYNQSLALKAAKKDSIGMFGTLNNLGIIHKKRNKYEEALEYYEKAYRIAKRLQYHQALINVQTSLSNLLNKLGQYDEAIDYAKAVISLAEQAKDSSGLAAGHINLGNAYMGNRQFRESEPHLNEGILLAESHSDLTIIQGGYITLSVFYEETKRYEQALEYHKKYKLISDSILNTENHKTTNELETKYQTEKKEKTIAEQKLEIAQSEAEIAQNNAVIGQQRFQNTLLIGGLLIILSLGAIFYIRNKAQSQARLQAAVIDEQQKGLEAVFTATEEERKRIAKDLHDGVGQQLSALKMSFQSLVQSTLGLPLEKVEGLDKLISDTADETRELSHQMMPRALTELGLTPAVDDMLRKTLGQTNIQYGFEHFNLQERYDERKEIAIYRIIQELVNNLIKHSGATEASIQLMENKSKLILLVEDNGKGISNIDTNGHGLLNIKNRLSPFDGKVNLELSEQSGTIARVILPV